MENFEKQEGWKPKINLKRIKPIYVVSFFLAACLIFIGWQFGWKKIEADIYQKGAEETRTAVIKDFTNQFIQTQKLQVPILVNSNNIPDLNGTGTAMGIFILQVPEVEVPPQQNATTTK